MRLDFTSDLTTTTTATLAATLYNDIRSARHNNRKLFPVLTGNARPDSRTSSATPRQAQIHSIARSQAGSGSTAAAAATAAAPPHTPMAHTHVHTDTHARTLRLCLCCCFRLRHCQQALRHFFLYLFYDSFLVVFFLLLLASTFIQLCPLTLP